MDNQINPEEFFARLRKEEEELGRLAASGDMEAKQTLARYEQMARDYEIHLRESEPRFSSASTPNPAWGMLDD